MMIDESVVRQINKVAESDPDEEIFGSDDIDTDGEIYDDYFYGDDEEDYPDEDEDLFDSYDDELDYDSEVTGHDFGF